MIIEWQWKKFSELTTTELYKIIQVREKVFVVEQKISYVDCDDFDQLAWHLSGLVEGQTVAYLRAFPPGVKYPEASFGRVLSDRTIRGQGFGKMLTQTAIEKMTSTFGRSPIKISAQAHLDNFYTKFGFKPEGSVYTEEGIPHLKMIRI